VGMTWVTATWGTVPGRVRDILGNFTHVWRVVALCTVESIADWSHSTAVCWSDINWSVHIFADYCLSVFVQPHYGYFPRFLCTNLVLMENFLYIAVYRVSFLSFSSFVHSGLDLQQVIWLMNAYCRIIIHAICAFPDAMQTVLKHLKL